MSPHILPTTLRPPSTGITVTANTDTQDWPSEHPCHAHCLWQSSTYNIRPLTPEHSLHKQEMSCTTNMQATGWKTAQGWCRSGRGPPCAARRHCIQLSWGEGAEVSAGTKNVMTTIG